MTRADALRYRDEVLDEMMFRTPDALAARLAALKADLSPDECVDLDAELLIRKAERERRYPSPRYPGTEATRVPARSARPVDLLGDEPAVPPGSELAKHKARARADVDAMTKLAAPPAGGGA